MVLTLLCLDAYPTLPSFSEEEESNLSWLSPLFLIFPVAPRPSEAWLLNATEMAVYEFLLIVRSTSLFYVFLPSDGSVTQVLPVEP